MSDFLLAFLFFAMVMAPCGSALLICLSKERNSARSSLREQNCAAIAPSGR